MLGQIKIKASALQEQIESKFEWGRFKVIKPGQAGKMDGRCNHIPKVERRLKVQGEGKGTMKVMGISKARKVGQEE